MKTVIEWINPKEKVPPFNTRILVLIGGQGSTNCMKNWDKYATIMDAIMTSRSPNDDDDETSNYDDFEAEDDKIAAFADYQFFVHCWYKFKYEGAGDGYGSDDWYSDAIVRWAFLPDFSESIRGAAA